MCMPNEQNRPATQETDPFATPSILMQYTLRKDVLRNVRASVKDGQEALPHFAILVRSHIGMKMARAKNPTTPVSTTIKIGPMASDKPATAYSTSSS